ncbi:hypothetical protein GGI07_000707 [Coemansia sp. Benny D115]|nr:hypothetical protein GGI07_000707 [Coemansia sp. Benny D115]
MYSHDVVLAACVSGLVLAAIALPVYLVLRSDIDEEATTATSCIDDLPAHTAASAEAQPLLSESAIRTRYATNPNEFAHSYIGRAQASSYLAPHSLGLAAGTDQEAPFVMAEHVVTLVPTDSSGSSDSGIESCSSNIGHGNKGEDSGDDMDMGMDTERGDAAEPEPESMSMSVTPPKEENAALQQEDEVECGEHAGVDDGDVAPRGSPASEAALDGCSNADDNIAPVVSAVENGHSAEHDAVVDAISEPNVEQGTEKGAPEITITNEQQQQQQQQENEIAQTPESDAVSVEQEQCNANTHVSEIGTTTKTLEDAPTESDSKDTESATAPSTAVTAAVKRSGSGDQLQVTKGRSLSQGNACRNNGIAEASADAAANMPGMSAGNQGHQEGTVRPRSSTLNAQAKAFVPSKSLRSSLFDRDVVHPPQPTKEEPGVVVTDQADDSTPAKSKHRGSAASSHTSCTSVSDESTTAESEKAEEQADGQQHEDTGIQEESQDTEVSASDPSGASVAKRRCRFWPSCSNRNCKYTHPSQTCRMYPNCTFGTNCIYIHPADVQKINMVISRQNMPSTGRKTKRKNQEIIRMNNLSAFVTSNN